MAPRAFSIASSKAFPAGAAPFNADSAKDLQLLVEAFVVRGVCLMPDVPGPTGSMPFSMEFDNQAQR